MSKVSAPVNRSNAASIDPETVDKWEQAQKSAKDAGIAWERPKGDNRSAQDIINDTPLLRDLGNQSGVRDMLEERVGGDIRTDADAAFRAVQVLEHVERLDENGDRIAGKDVDNGRVDGFTKGGDAKHGTEAGRLQDFGKYGFSNLKGELNDVSSVGDDKEAREQAEKAGIKWELPESDKRSAQDIIGDSPLLANLGNQSGVKDMLKERVGDFENDANAAYRASQILDRITMYDDKGNSLSGSDVSNTSIDGFTKSGEAKHGTEAGRLQDFGKYGFEVIKDVKKPEDISSYKDFLKANPDADETSKTLAKYTAILGENYDAIRGKTGSGEHLTAESLKKYMDENPQISTDFKEALNFWSQPGAFSKLETANASLQSGPDGKLGAADLKSWMETQAPKDSASAITLISEVTNANITADVDTSKLGADVFEHPENYSAAEKAAVLQDLLKGQSLITEGAAAGMWKDDYGKVSIANSVSGHPDPQKLLQDVNEHISILEKDPEVVKYLNENSAKQVDALFKNNEGLKTAVEATYKDDIKSGKALDSLWDAKTKDGKTDQQGALAEFYGSAKMFQQTLGIDKPGEIQEAVSNSKHKDDFQSFYEKSLVSGDRLKELLKDNTFEEAASAFSTEIALYNAALDPEFTGKFDSKLNENFSNIAQDNAFKDASFDDLKTAFGVNGGDQLDEEKVKSYLEQISKDNPELLVNQDGTVAKPDQILAGFRGTWDVLRQGTKSLAELSPTWLDPSTKAAADKGVLHGVSGLFMAGVTISKGIQSGGNPTERQKVDITTGAVLTATLLTEGGIKAWKTYLSDVAEKHPDSAIGKTIGKLSEDNFKKLTDNWTRAENAAKGIGGLASIVAGAYGIFDGVQSIRKGDTVGGGISITAGSLGALAGLASAVEGGLGVFAPNILRTLPIAGVAGVLGLAAAGVGAIAMLLPGLIEEGKQQARQDKFGDLLSGYLTKYEIDGVPNGDIFDIPDEEWPDSDSGIAS